mgnify:CR=1 FL=1
MARSLYICYFGVREPLVQTQVLPYLRELLREENGLGETGGSDRQMADEEQGTLPGLVEKGKRRVPIEISLLTFEPQLGDDDLSELSVVRDRLAEEGIEWDWLPYHKRPSSLATAWDILRGAFYIWRRIGRYDILHGRVHVPTLMGAIARKFSRKTPKLLFDIRGFFPEEYVDAGIWPGGGYLYRGAKWVERWLLKESDAFVVLTEKARDILFPESRGTGRDRSGRPVEVIPCCVDLSKFPCADGEARNLRRGELGVNERRVIVYVGSFGGWYLTEELFSFFAAARNHDPKTYILVLSQRDTASIEERARRSGFANSDFGVFNLPPIEIHRYVSAADIAVSLIKNCYSKQASSPTKIAEYLACGVPIIANAGVGDMDELIISRGVGILVNELGQEGYLEALRKLELMGDVRDRCRETAEMEFDLKSVGGARYRILYDKILDT